MPPRPKSFWELNLGHLLTGIGMAGSAFWMVVSIETRLVSQDVRLSAIQASLSDQAVVSRDLQRQISEISTHLAEVGARLPPSHKAPWVP